MFLLINYREEMRNRFVVLIIAILSFSLYAQQKFLQAEIFPSPMILVKHGNIYDTLNLI